MRKREMRKKCQKNHITRRKKGEREKKEKKWEGGGSCWKERRKGSNGTDR